ncbi:MAG: J domain-containing protein [Deltaproteobacteria bacterium]|nr:J domain-containing protein [Deltaproteobacteria bacterium]
MTDTFKIEDISFPILMKDLVESSFSGILFVSNEKWRKGLILNTGKLCAIQSNNPDELLGNMLIKMGIINEEENEASLKEAKIEMQKQGVILLGKGIVQPEEISYALKQQLETRFLDIFTWESGNVQKIEKQTIDKTPELSNNELARLIRKGVMEQASFSLVIDALSPYADARPRRKTDSFPGDIGVDIDEIDHYKVSEILLFGQDMPRALLGLYCTGVITFEESKFKALIDKLRKRLREIKDRDPFDILGVDRDFSDGGLKRAYIKIVKANHPDTYSYADDPEVKRLANEVFTEIQKAYNTVLKNRDGKPVEKAYFDQALQAELLYSQATQAIKTKDYQKATDLLRMCVKMKPEERVFTEVLIKTLFLKWQNTGLGSSIDIKTAAREALKHFPQSDTVYMILGWVLKKEHSSKSIAAFQKALQINPDNAEAQREIRLFRMRNKS